ncbi:2-C-methyl-D-erythritol 4-phosphate cytidylyltransferase [Thermomonas sp.]|jgi:2-C-methyl-D-erythritol 4-phosphate cytidylyltransferase|uniref:2-C-methyl-D-erythritol 4-phosphate cytidylyltransferase n=1 Tax=Thermomonas sp. TaxID=1971895 RepID=UPI002392D8DC|nr:2-C-methyl-D-erythritol 4-phosphate cytidylyltransferase [Thermomonas sp.]MBS0458649.1 2-C-methyl-D-erythritol 4-phosphate cytidylyltransferase [Pseudomonadota bacterium]MDE2382060.1 2-C-methyl-D-erythritol 4-phosphate cytidylyltransferase [Xanthomonadaceae bacterium]HOC10088.1 2-C-methyl-D-erythritol 4-phosphate cytidylyltransferase [Thermomonas sp.]HQA01800.1 2-C-methyl-D-erythritol 4-phosphate cytidylyltransferase [Thermomonas sp.]HQE07756.1 2-C-methyl-D-erythritol 4-phosphate cytidylylt
MIWALVPAAGSGRRFGGDVPKQYLHAAGKPLIGHALEALLAHPQMDGAVVALAADDPHWPGWTTLHGKPVVTCVGGLERADSVLAALHALPENVAHDALLLVHDAARPNVHGGDLSTLIAAANVQRDGAILAAPVRDTLKASDADHRIEATVPRAGLWRALTPQAFRRDLLQRALQAAQAAGVTVTDEAMAVERLGLHPVLVEGREDNLKVTTPADLALVEFLLARAA